MLKATFALAIVLLVSVPAGAQAVEYKVLATSKTSTMEKEMNEAGGLGYKFVSVMGGDTAIGGSEVVVLMQKSSSPESGKFRYKLLAATRTGTMQRELADAAMDGYDYVGHTVFETLFGGEEVVAIIERGAANTSPFIYKLVAASRTSTLEKEMRQLGTDGYVALGMTVAKTALGGSEIVVIARKKK